MQDHIKADIFLNDNPRKKIDITLAVNEETQLLIAGIDALWVGLSNNLLEIFLCFDNPQQIDRFISHLEHAKHLDATATRL